jgi:hypothetical protein
MSTTAQVLANRANAKRSTGPTTAEGKQNSSQNATTHGFYSKAFVIADAERADFETLRDQLRGGYAPVDFIGEDLFQQILHASWNLFRLRRIENQIYAATEDPFGDDKILKKLDALRRHKSHFERALLSARKQFSDYLTSCWTLSAVPPDIRVDLSPSVNAEAFNRAHIHKWKIYRPEDFANREQIEAERAEDKLRQRVVAKTRRELASRPVLGC